ncbi:unnamed protein product [Symbiodinium natans]|uniref:Uncharacterized protein n=1 Tax=Symbiodinium natans TaxID=878477 RepID=A0A812SCY6_9DINO|nr:unnamed protein product [Symbiodinium natans]
MGQLPRLVLLPQLVMISTAQPPWLEQLVMCNLHWPLRHVQVVDSKLMVQNAKEPPRPVVPSRFGASITFSILDTSSLCGYMAGQGYFSQDVGREVLRIETIRPFPRKMMFKATNLTMLSIGREGSSSFNQSLCADGNRPVELNITTSQKKVEGIETKYISYRFMGIEQVDTMPDKLACDVFCKSSKSVALDAYVFHPSSPASYSIEDQDVSDLLGDALYICMDGLQNHSSFTDHDYSLVSRYSLRISSAFGQYALCNGYPDTTPPEPVCRGGDVRERGCTWSILKRLKTISKACLLHDHGFLSHCSADLAQGREVVRMSEDRTNCDVGESQGKSIG